MFSNKLVVLLVVMLLGPVVSSAQIVIHSTDWAGIGTTYTWGIVDSATFDVGHPGENQTWTFGSQTFSRSGWTDFVSPQSAAHGNLFPTASYAMHTFTPGDTSYDYYAFERLAQNGLYYLGSVAGQECTILSSEELSVPLPLQYQTTLRFGISDTMVNVPGLLWLRIDSLYSLADGWGTVQTPYGSSPCLRLFQQWQEWILENGAIQSYWENLSYQWLDQAGIAVVSVSAPDGVTDPNFTTGHLNMTGVPLASDPGPVRVASDFSLRQNYPNPFNPTTEITFDLPRTIYGTLKVFDVLGREVAVLANGTMQSGEHRIAFDGSRLPSGVYFYQLKAGEFVQTKKMLLLK
jgi:hypothetical protein